MAGIYLLWLVFATSLAATEAGVGRLTGTFAGIDCEYSPGQEKLARALALRFARHNQQIAAAQPVKAQEKTGIVPLSPSEMRANRAIYLGRIAELLALEKPTALQEDCYNAFLANYEETMFLYDLFSAGYRSLLVVKRFALWDKTDLVRRLEKGEKVVGMAYDPATKSGYATYGGEIGRGTRERLAQLEENRKNLKILSNLNLETKNGETSYRGHFELNNDKKGAMQPSTSISEPTPAGGVTQWFPVIIPPGMPSAPPEKLAQIIWDNSVLKMFDPIMNMSTSVPHMDPQIAFVILHESTETGIIDYYFHGRDRRWFCDGVANYVAWRVLRDLYGNAKADNIHNLPAQLVRYADMRRQADLRAWPAVENESDSDQHSRLDEARYAFAERAVFLMNERMGESILPKLFTEIGRTPRNKVSIKTVDKAWKKLSGTKLESILIDAVKPVPVTPALRPTG